MVWFSTFNYWKLKAQVLVLSKKLLSSEGYLNTVFPVVACDLSNPDWLAFFSEPMTPS